MKGEKNMKSLKMLVSGILVFAIIVFSLNAAAQEYTLKYNLPKNTSLTLINSNEVNQTIDQMGTEMTTLITSSFEGALKVQNSDAKKGLDFEMEYKAMSQGMESDMGGGAADFTELIGKTVKFNLSPSGVIGNTVGFDQLPVVVLPTQEELKEETYVIQVKNSFIKLPEGPVKIGDTWTDKQEENVPMPGDGSLKIITNYTYKLVEEVQKDNYPCLKVDVQLIQTLTGKFEQQGMVLSMEMNGDGKGTVYFAQNKAMVLYSEISSNLEGAILVEEMGMELAMSSDSKSTTTIKF